MERGRVVRDMIVVKRSLLEAKILSEWKIILNGVKNRHKVASPTPASHILTLSIIGGS